MRLIDADALKNHIKIFNIGCGCSEDYQKSFLNAIDEQPTIQPEQRWIPCSEGLPQPNERDGDVPKYYLVQNEYGDMMVAMYRMNRAGEVWWEQMYAYAPINNEIVAWQPLPELYRKGGDE